MQRLVGLALALALFAAPAATAAPHDHGNGKGRLGVLIVDHGEPPEYNELTYWSFRAFFDHLIEMGLIPSWVKALDGGTVAADRRCYGCAEPSTGPTLMDAWLHPQEGPGAFVPASSSLPAHYVVPGGPGRGEPDVFEHVGLQVWHEWKLMGGRSPNFDQKLRKKRAVIRRLGQRFGRDLPIRVGYGIDPRIGGRNMSIRAALTALVNQDRVERIVVAYHGVGHSDIMQTHMIRHEIHEILDELGAKVTLSYADPLGKTDTYVGAVVQKVESELRRLPEGARVAFHLSGHGLGTDMCGEYDCGADAYHESSRSLFRRTKAAIERNVSRPGLGVFHLYGEGGADEDDPNDEVDSPLEALAKRKKAGFDYVIDIPYEFDSDSRDTLIILRHGYERHVPDWNHRYESHFKRSGMHVKITNASFGSEAKTKAFEEVVVDAIERAQRGGGDRKHH